MSRPLLTLYDLDRPALKALSSELRAALTAADVDALAQLLELGESAREVLASFPRVVEPFLLPQHHARAKLLWASLRRIAKKRALTCVSRSDSPALEGRLRAFEPLRDDRQAAVLVDKLLNPQRLPWFLRRRGASGGWLDGDQCQQLATRMRRLRPRLTPELQAFADVLRQLDADAVLHDGL
ncbi:MAG TPA: hypothetical protein ENK23_06615 [Sorangium sp.]|nr:hypothetical protein [Sorangium sp.]